MMEDASSAVYSTLLPPTPRVTSEGYERFLPTPNCVP